MGQKISPTVMGVEQKEVGCSQHVKTVMFGTAQSRRGLRIVHIAVSMLSKYLKKTLLRNQMLKHV